MSTENVSREDYCISGYIKRHQQERGVTQTMMAKAAGRSQPYISAHLACQWSWCMNDLSAISRLFGFTNVASFISEALSEHRHSAPTVQ